MKTAKERDLLKFQINPEYEGSEEQKHKSFSLSQTLDDYWSLQPGECGAKIPEKGCWMKSGQNWVDIYFLKKWTIRVCKPS